MKTKRSTTVAKATGLKTIRKNRRAFDPVMDEVIDIIDGIPIAQIERRTGVSGSCIRAWRKHKTRNPQNVTMDFVLRAAGFHRPIVRMKPGAKR